VDRSKNNGMAGGTSERGSDEAGEAARGRLRSLPTGEAAPPDGRIRELSGWGQHPVVRGVERLSENLPEITRDAVLSRGLGRAYGDASLPPEGSRSHVAGSRLADRILAFDEQTGVLRAEAGLSLAELNRIFLPRGFASPVSTGTAFVTLGGMVASDVHGRNHHVAGCFGEHVRALRLQVADGRVLDISPEDRPDLFHACFGGMGLLGHVLEVELQLMRIPSRWIHSESVRLGSIEELLPALLEERAHWPYTAAWLDCTARGAALGRGILEKGRWATAAEAPSGEPRTGPPLMIPFRFPSGLANRHTFRILNTLWYRKHPAAPRSGVGSVESFFYPLDRVGHWHRVYGGRGFTQYQCVIPAEVPVFREFLERFQRGGGSSFVTVLKDCGPSGKGPLSFPQPGASLALDIPIHGRGAEERIRQLVASLNEFVIDHGGRIYLAKDAFTSPEHFRRMYPRLEEWEALRREWDPEGRISSAQSRRLLGS
jgi:FAD/FMN-containing dehydrogenase